MTKQPFIRHILSLWPALALLGAAGVVLLPMGEVVATALSGQSIWGRVWQQVNWGRSLLNTLFVALSVTGLQLVTAALAGYALARLRFWGRRWLLGGIVVSLAVPFQVLVIPIFLVLKAGHLLNTYGALILPTAANGFSIYLLFQCFQSLPQDLEAAAALDGARRWQILWYVMLPLARPTLVTLFLLTFIGEWNDLFKPLVFTTRPELQTVQLALTGLQQQFTTDWSLQMMAVVVATVPVVGLFLIAQRQIVEGVAAQGLKE